MCRWPFPAQIVVPLNATDMGGLPGDSRGYSGAGPWIVESWEPDLRMYYTGTANAHPLNAVPRGNGKFDNVGAASVVAVDADTGKVQQQDQLGGRLRCRRPPA